MKKYKKLIYRLRILIFILFVIIFCLYIIKLSTQDPGEEVQHHGQRYIKLVEEAKLYSSNLSNQPKNVVNQQEDIENRLGKSILSLKLNISSSLNEAVTSIPITMKPVSPVVVSNPPGVMVVGGTDGSGTRSVVHLLSKLGVYMTGMTSLFKIE